MSVCNRDLLIDKYRPKSLADLTFNKDANLFLTAVAKQKDMPHMILEGTRGAGKRLRAQLYLKEKYGDFTINSKTLNLDIPGKGESREIHLLYSKYHHQLNPSIHNIYDRSLMQCITSEIIHARLLFDIPYRIIIIEDADLLSDEAQESLRRTLETCIGSCRFIFLANNEGRLIAPIYSRCITVRIAAPTVTESIHILTDICRQEACTIPESTLTNIAQCRDLQKSINTLNRLLVNATPYSRMDYDHVYRHCTEIIDQIVKGSTIVGTMDRDVRGLIYSLVNYCVDCRSLLPILLNIVLNKLPENAHDERHEVSRIASERDISIRSSSKDIYHVESFCLHLFKVVKTLMLTKQKLAPKVHARAVKSDVGA